jgi:hypothetical protein
LTDLLTAVLLAVLGCEEERLLLRLRLIAFRLLDLITK